MIPTYRPREDYLRKSIESVLQQNSGSNQMQIEVVDDSSPDIDVEMMVNRIAGKRITFSRTQKNLGLAGCWNACIGRSRGQWVHILHQDDYVLPGFYSTLAQAAERHPEAGLLASRSFFVDAAGIIYAVSERLKKLENGSRTIEDFFYRTPIQCPGVVVKRSFYETHGGFRSDLTYALDCEMWVRVIGSAGGWATPEVLSCYRQSDTSETGRLCRSAENLKDIDRLNRIFFERYPEFDLKQAKAHQLGRSLQMAALFEEKNDQEAAATSWDYWKRNASIPLRLRRFFGGFKRKPLK